MTPRLDLAPHRWRSQPPLTPQSYAGLRAAARRADQRVRLARWMRWIVAVMRRVG